MANKSRACFCASSVATFLGLIMIIVSFGIIAKIGVEKIDAEYQSTSGVVRNDVGRSNQQGFQQNYNQPNYNQQSRQGQSSTFTRPLQQFGSILDSNSSNTWIILIVLMAVGVVITLFGFICSNCAICCCPQGSSSSGRRGSVSQTVAPIDSEMKEWSDA
jgi:predicted PurR-regulated permease PerM